MSSPSERKKVLVIAYHFPPGGGPGVQRVLKHVTYLSQGGWDPVVLTVENGDFPARDESLLQQIPANVPVIRVPIVEPYSLYRKFIGSKGAAVDVNVNKSASERRGFKENVAHCIRATFFIPDARVFWWRKATRSALLAVQQHNISALYSSSPPYTCALIARSVQQKTGLPWVAGFRDPWTNFLTTPDRWFLPAAIDRMLERSVFRRATAIECAWNGIITDALEKMPWLDRQKLYHVPNGFDRADFPDISYTPNERFTITYTGSLYGHRTPKALIEALEQLVTKGTITTTTIKLQFAGRFGTDIEQMFQQSTIAESIQVLGYVSHGESISYLMKSELNVLIVDDAKESAEIVPGKVYEYLGVGRPILAIAPEGSAVHRLITETQAGRCISGSNIADIALFLSEAIECWRNGTPIATPDEVAIAQYERRNAALALASILDNVSQT